MDYSTLKSRVQDAMGRTDVPTYVYELVTSDINRDLRVLDMQSTSTLSVTGEDTALPADFLEMISAYIDASPRGVLVPATDDSLNYRHDSSGRPSMYAITSGNFRVMPVPDGTYSVPIRYYAKLANLSADADTNAIMSTFPGIYIYGALRHAAVWAQDESMASVYNQAFNEEMTLAKRSDLSRRSAGPMTRRPWVGGF